MQTVEKGEGLVENFSADLPKVRPDTNVDTRRTDDSSSVRQGQLLLTEHESSFSRSITGLVVEGFKAMSGVRECCEA